MKFTIGDRVFSSKQSALEAVRKVLHGVPIGTPLTGEDFVLIRALLDKHHGVDRKLANGCQAIVVPLNKIEGMPIQRGFWIIGDDGFETDFSLYVPFRTDAQNHNGNQGWAARHAVAESTTRVKTEYFAGRDQALCQISGKMMGWKQAHVHHGAPKLVDRGMPAIMLMTDEDAAEFVAFHDSRAILLVVDKKIHLGLKKGNGKE